MKRKPRKLPKSPSRKPPKPAQIKDRTVAPLWRDPREQRRFDKSLDEPIECVAKKPDDIADRLLILQSLPPFTIVDVYWIDAVISTTGWQTIADFRIEPDVHHRTVGMYMGQTDLVLKVCLSRQLYYVDEVPRDVPLLDTQVCGLVAIPKFAIQTLRILE